MLTYSVFQTKWRTTTKAENSARGSAFVLCWRFSPGAELQANLHKRDSFCTGRSDVECVTQREGKKPCPTQAQIPSGDGAFLLRRDDQSNDLIVHFLNQVSRLLDCDSAQDFKAEGYRCQMRDSVLEHFHLNYGLSLTCFP